MAEAGCDWDFIEVDIAGIQHRHHPIGSISSEVSELTFIHEHSSTGKLETSDHAPLDFLFKTTGEELYDMPVAVANPFCSKPCCTI
jgi:hypothetical protein